MRWLHIVPRNNTSVRVGSAVSARSDLSEVAGNFDILFHTIDEVVAVMYVAPAMHEPSTRLTLWVHVVLQSCLTFPGVHPG